MFTYIELIVITSTMVTIGIILGMKMKKYNQKNLCPHCSCRENCNIGCKVEGIDEIGCTLCMSKSYTDIEHN